MRVWTPWRHLLSGALRAFPVSPCHGQQDGLRPRKGLCAPRGAGHTAGLSGKGMSFGEGVCDKGPQRCFGGTKRQRCAPSQCWRVKSLVEIWAGSVCPLPAPGGPGSPGLRPPHSSRQGQPLGISACQAPSSPLRRDYVPPHPRCSGGPARWDSRAVEGLVGGEHSCTGFCLHPHFHLSAINAQSRGTVLWRTLRF